MTTTIFPFAAGRNPGVPDNDEMIVIRLPDRFPLDRRVLGIAVAAQQQSVP